MTETAQTDFDSDPLNKLADEVRLLVSNGADVRGRALHALVQETKRRQREIEKALGDARTALDDMRLAGKYLEFSESANLHDAQRALHSVRKLTANLSPQ